MSNVNVFMLLTPKANVAFLFSNDSLENALEKMRSHGYMSIPVLTEDGKYLGSVSEGDFLWSLADMGFDFEGYAKKTVSEVINTCRNTAVRVDVSIEELYERVLNQNFVPVIDDRGFFIGIVTRKDVMGSLLQSK